MRLRHGLELAFLIGCLVGLAQASMTFEYRIYNVGYIKSIGVSFYSDAACLDQVSEINWGSVSFGGQSSVILYAKNTGSEPATLIYRTENWMPPLAETMLSFSWDYDGSAVVPLGAVAITFQLGVGVAVHDIWAFSFDIVVTAT